MEEVTAIFNECLNADLGLMLNWSRDDIKKRYYAIYDACVGKPQVLAEISNKLIRELGQFSKMYHHDEKLLRLEYMSFIFRYVRRRMKEVISQEDPFLSFDISMDDNETLSQILSRRVFAQK